MARKRLPTPFATMPLAAGAAAIGDEPVWSRAGHRHPSKLLQVVTASAQEVTDNVGRTISNEGAGAKVIRTMIGFMAAGYNTAGVVMNANGLQLKAAAGQTIRDGTSVSAVAGYIESTELGAYIELLAVNTTQWVVIAKKGTWTLA